MDQHKTQDEELKRLCVETEELPGVKTAQPAKEKPVTVPEFL
jgi:hypothetical protein